MNANSRSNGPGSLEPDVYQPAGKTFKTTEKLVFPLRMKPKEAMWINAILSTHSSALNKNFDRATAKLQLKEVFRSKKSEKLLFLFYSTSTKQKDRQ